MEVIAQASISSAGLTGPAWLDWTRCSELPAPLAPLLGRAWELLGRSAADVLAAVVPDRARQDALRPLVTLDHVGLVVPVESVAEASEIARAAGFDHWHSRFPSTILARELGALLGLAILPTTALKVCGPPGPEGHARVVEIFMPHAGEPIVRDWMRRGIGAHVAFSLRGLDALADARRVLEADGFRLPEFLRGGPLTNPVERITTIYFDPPAGAGALRVELCVRDG